MFGEDDPSLTGDTKTLYNVLNIDHPCWTLPKDLRWPDAINPSMDFLEVPD